VILKTPSSTFCGVSGFKTRRNSSPSIFPPDTIATGRSNPTFSAAARDAAPAPSAMTWCSVARAADGGFDLGDADDDDLVDQTPQQRPHRVEDAGAAHAVDEAPRSLFSSG